MVAYILVCVDIAKRRNTQTHIAYTHNRFILKELVVRNIPRSHLFLFIYILLFESTSHDWHVLLINILSSLRIYERHKQQQEQKV